MNVVGENTHNDCKSIDVQSCMWNQDSRQSAFKKTEEYLHILEQCGSVELPDIPPSHYQQFIFLLRINLET